MNENIKRVAFDFQKFEQLSPEWAARTQFFPQIGSTNEEARQQLRSGRLSSEAVLLTDQQVAGRGRLGRVWQAPAYSGLLFTLVFPLRLSLNQAFLYAAALALAVQKTCGDLAEVSLNLKWPNDLLHEGKKVAGLLAELESGLGPNRNQYWVALGCGLNASITPEEFAEAGLEEKAFSVLLNAARQISREELFVGILANWQKYRQQLENNPVALRQEWSSQLITLGKWVEAWMNGQIEASGTAIGVDEDGALIIREVTGIERHFPAADVSVRLPDGRYSA